MDPSPLIPSLESRLDALDITQLKTLILRMIERHAELEALVDTTLVATGAQVDLKKVRMRVRRFLGWDDNNWRTSGRIATALDEVIADGEELCAQGRWPEAVPFFGVILEEINAVYGTMYDSESEVARTVGGVIQSLGTCLANTRDATVRSTILHTLLATLATDLALGGLGLADGVPEVLLAGASPEEKRMIAGWVRARITGNDTSTPATTSWTQTHLGEFLLQLEIDDFDDATYLRVCREAGLWQRQAKKLLELDRVDEAIEVVGRHLKWDVLEIAEAFEQHGQADRLALLLRERVNDAYSTHYRDWLIRHAEARGRWDDAFEVAEIQFAHHPSVEHYNGLKRIATSLGIWPERRQALLKGLEARKRHAVLTQFYLADGDAGAALHWLKVGLKAGIPSGDVPDTLILEVAKAASSAFPLESARLYRMVALQEVRRRERRHYAEAARLLAKARDLYRQAGEEEEWNRVISEIRDGNRILRALQEELRGAGL